MDSVIVDYFSENPMFVLFSLVFVVAAIVVFLINKRQNRISMDDVEIDVYDEDDGEHDEGYGNGTVHIEFSAESVELIGKEVEKVVRRVVNEVLDERERQSNAV